MCCNFPDYLSNKQYAKTCHQEFIDKNITRGSSKEENQEVSKVSLESRLKITGVY